MRDLVAAAAVFLALAGVARAEPERTWTLERKPDEGERVRVVETLAKDLEAMWRGRRSTVGNAEREEVERRYDQEVRAGQPRRLYRRYAHSTRAKYEPGGEPRPERTSLHGRAVVVTGLRIEPDGAFEVSKKDREALRYDRLVEALLPPGGAVAKGDDWEVPAEEIGRALFGDHVAPANVEGAGARVRLRKVREEAGQQVAVLRVEGILFRLTRTEQLPGLDLELQGEVAWAVEEGALLEATLEGPVRFVLGSKRGTLEAEGRARWRYEAELLEPRLAPSDAEREAGAPPPPGTRVLVCEDAPAHRYPIGQFAHCLRCGRALEDRRCPEHGWALQRCPRDGGRLQPE